MFAVTTPAEQYAEPNGHLLGILPQKARAKLLSLRTAREDAGAVVRAAT